MRTISEQDVENALDAAFSSVVHRLGLTVLAESDAWGGRRDAVNLRLGRPVGGGNTAEFARLAALGWTAGEIAIETGVTPKSVYQWAKRKRVTLHTKRGLEN